MYFIIHFFGSLPRSREISNTTFCTVEKTLHLLYTVGALIMRLSNSASKINFKSNNF